MIVYILLFCVFIHRLSKVNIILKQNKMENDMIIFDFMCKKNNYYIPDKLNKIFKKEKQTQIVDCE